MKKEKGPSLEDLQKKRTIAENSGDSKAYDSAQKEIDAFFFDGRKTPRPPKRFKQDQFVGDFEGV